MTKRNKVRLFRTTCITGSLILTTMFCGCYMYDVKAVAQSSTKGLSIKTEVQQETPSVQNENAEEDTFLKSIKELYTKQNKYKIENSSAFICENYTKIFDFSKSENLDIQLVYASYTYNRILEANIPEEIMLKELNNLMVEQYVPRCMMDEAYWDQCFHNLNSTLKEEESLFDTYLPLAYFIHIHTCTNEHHLEDDSIKCLTLKNAFYKE